MTSIVPVSACILCSSQCLPAYNAYGSSRCLSGFFAMRCWMKRRIAAMCTGSFFTDLQSRGTFGHRSSPWSGFFELPARLPSHCPLPQSSSAWSPRTTCRPAFGAGPAVSPVFSAPLGLASPRSCPARLDRVADATQAFFYSDWAATLASKACLPLRLWICSYGLMGFGCRLFCLALRFSVEI